ncbi:MAG TPA: hypothetical protein VD999_01640 [Vitreimonas sp.]|nr:hypothetical protein [Vitreimonas sp.]
MKKVTSLEYIKAFTKDYIALLVCGLIGVGIVTVSYFARLDGSRSSTDAYVPLHLTPVEVAVLLQKPDSTKVLRLSSDKVTVGTTVYPLKLTEPPLDSSPSLVKYKGTFYWLGSNSWEKYYAIYTVPKSDLERELDRTVTKEEIDTEYFVNHRVSLVSEHVWFYLIFESVVIGGILYWYWWLVYRVLKKRISWWLFIPGFTLSGIFVFITVLIYSPAFFDGDFFYQRIVLEELFILSFFTTPLLFFLSVICCLIWGILYMFQPTGNLKLAKTHNYKVAGVLLFIICLQLLIDYRSFVSERTYTNQALTAIVNDLDTATLQQIKQHPFLNTAPETENLYYKQLPDELSDIFASLTKSEYAVRGNSVSISIGLLGEEKGLFLWNRPDSLSYADVRTPFPDPALAPVVKTPNLRKAIYEKTAYQTSFIRYLSRPYVASKVISDEDGSVQAIVVSHSEFDSKRFSLFRVIASLLWFW